MSYNYKGLRTNVLIPECKSARENAMNQRGHALIEIRLRGENVTPSNVSSRELAEVIASIEEMVAPLVIQGHPELKEDEIIVGLVGISDGSIRLEFSPQLSSPVFEAYTKVADSINRDDYSDLPFKSIESLQVFTRFARRRNCEMELWTQNGSGELLATIRPNTLIETPHIQVISAPTVLHGRIFRVGGKEPKVAIELPDGSTVTCDVQEALAIELGQYLYKWVRLQGEASWRFEDLSLESFRIQTVTPFENVSITEAFQGLADLTGRYILEIEDVENYIAELRGNDEGDVDDGGVS